MKHHSTIESRSANIRFPEFTGERIYMHPFFQCEGLPSKFRHWQDVVDIALDGIVTDSPIYLMVDQRRVRANTTHRRPGIHVDGFWGHNGVYDTVRDGKEWVLPQTCYHQSHTRLSHGFGHDNFVSLVDRSAPRHLPPSPSHLRVAADEAIILMSDVTASRALIGEYEFDLTDDGNCEGVDLSGLTSVSLDAGAIHVGNTFTLHESLPVLTDCDRTVVRLNVPNWRKA